MVEHLKTCLQQFYNRHFQVTSEAISDAGRVVTPSELITYIDLLENFESVKESINDKSELCKCAALHSDIIDRAFRHGKGDYDRWALYFNILTFSFICITKLIMFSNRNTPWTSDLGNLSIFKTAGDLYKYDPMFDVQIYWTTNIFKYPFIIVEEKPNSKDSGCAEDR